MPNGRVKGVGNDRIAVSEGKRDGQAQRYKSWPSCTCSFSRHVCRPDACPDECFVASMSMQLSGVSVQPQEENYLGTLPCFTHDRPGCKRSRNAVAACRLIDDRNGAI